METTSLECDGWEVSKGLKTATTSPGVLSPLHIAGRARIS